MDWELTCKKCKSVVCIPLMDITDGSSDKTCRSCGQLLVQRTGSGTDSLWQLALGLRMLAYNDAHGAAVSFVEPNIEA